MTPAAQRNLIITLGGGVIVLIAAVTAAMLLGRSGGPASPDETAANSTGLQVQLGKQARLDPNAELRCFVDGKYVGMQTTAQCAAKNGIPPGSLDVGLDQSGALSGATSGSVPLKPLSDAPPPAIPVPPLQTAQADTGPASEAASPSAASDDQAQPAGGQCLRYSGSGWTPAGGANSLDACVHALFEGRCLAAGETIYGRWAGQTLRLQPGHVDIAGDNRSFRPLAPQAADCTIPPV
jgi:hypothetical protein